MTRERRREHRTESRPPISEERRQLNRSLTEKVLERAASDPRWKQQLLDDPEAAMRTADFPETQQILETQASAEAPEEYEVRGQAPLAASVSVVLSKLDLEMGEPVFRQRGVTRYS